MPPITFKPPGPDFGEVPATRGVSCDVIIENDHGSAIDVSIADDGGGNRFRILRGDTSVPAGQTATITIGFKSDTVPNHSPVVTGTLSAGRHTARVTATVLSPIQIEEESVDCGDTLIDTRVTSTVRVTNSHATADATLTLEGADIDAFEVVPTDVSPSGVGQAVWIRFRPNKEGRATATLKAQAGTFNDTCDLSGVGVAVVEEVGDEAEGEGSEPRQRFHVEVPSPHTYLGMGASLGEDSHMALAIDGVGLETEENIFINGVGEESKLFAQAVKNVVIQSVDESLYTSAKENNVMCAGEFSYVLGSKGVVIAAGLPLRYNSLSPLDGTHDTTAPHTWAMGFAATDAIVGTMLTVLDGFRVAHEWKDMTKWGRGFEAFGRVATLTGAAMSAAGAADLVPAATLLGLAGVVVATPAFVAMYGLSGIGMVSTYPSMIGILDAAILAGRDVTITSLRGDATFQGRVMELHARREINVEASSGKLFAPISFEGSQFEVKAHKKVIAVAGPEGPKVAAGAGKVVIDADKQVVIGVGKFLVKVTEDEVQIGMRPNEHASVFDRTKATVHVKEGEVVLHPSGAPNARAQVKLAGAVGDLASGDNSRVKVTPSGVKLESANVRLDSRGPLKLRGGIITLG
jgi:hypothetical protein